MSASALRDMVSFRVVATLVILFRSECQRTSTTARTPPSPRRPHRSADFGRQGCVEERILLRHAPESLVSGESRATRVSIQLNGRSRARGNLAMRSLRIGRFWKAKAGNRFPRSAVTGEDSAFPNRSLSELRSFCFNRDRFLECTFFAKPCGDANVCSFSLRHSL